MTHIESESTSVQAPIDTVYTFLNNTDNIEKLLPEGKYSEWKSDGNNCSFKIQNAYTIGLEITATNPHNEITYSSTPGSPFPFTLKVQLNASGSDTQGKLICDAQINPFLEMMVKGPLKNLFDYMAAKLPTAMGA